MFTKTFLAATLASIAVAAPVEQRQAPDAFSLITTHSGNEFVHLREFAANGERFWIGKPTATFCPEGVASVDCSTASNSTSVVAQPNTASTLSMNVIVPGGQSAYVTSDGQVGYTIAHSGVAPAGSVNTPWEYTPATTNTNGLLKFNGQDFAACPTADADVFQIYAAGASGFVRTDCISIGLVQSSFTAPAPAWQYE